MKPGAARETLRNGQPLVKRNGGGARAAHQFYVSFDQCTQTAHRRLMELDREWDIERVIELEAPLTIGAGLALGTTLDRRWSSLGRWRHLSRIGRKPRPRVSRACKLQPTLADLLNRVTTTA